MSEDDLRRAAQKFCTMLQRRGSEYVLQLITAMEADLVARCGAEDDEAIKHIEQRIDTLGMLLTDALQREMLACQWGLEENVFGLPPRSEEEKAQLALLQRERHRDGFLTAADADADAPTSTSSSSAAGPPREPPPAPPTIPTRSRPAEANHRHGHAAPPLPSDRSSTSEDAESDIAALQHKLRELRRANHENAAQSQTLNRYLEALRRARDRLSSWTTLQGPMADLGAQLRDLRSALTALQAQPLVVQWQARQWWQPPDPNSNPSDEETALRYDAARSQHHVACSSSTLDRL